MHHRGSASASNDGVGSFTLSNPCASACRWPGRINSLHQHESVNSPHPCASACRWPGSINSLRQRDVSARHSGIRTTGIDPSSGTRGGGGTGGGASQRELRSGLSRGVAAHAPSSIPAMPRIHLVASSSVRHGSDLPAVVVPSLAPRSPLTLSMRRDLRHQPIDERSAFASWSPPPSGRGHFTAHAPPDRSTAAAAAARSSLPRDLPLHRSLSPLRNPAPGAALAVPSRQRPGGAVTATSRHLPHGSDLTAADPTPDLDPAATHDQPGLGTEPLPEIALLAPSSSPCDQTPSCRPSETRESGSGNSVTLPMMPHAQP